MTLKEKFEKKLREVSGLPAEAELDYKNAIAILFIILALSSMYFINRNTGHPNYPAVTQVNAPELDNGAITIACRNAIKEQIRYESKADFSIFREGISQTEPNKRMTGEVEVMNGLGNMIPVKFFCTFKGNILTSAVIVQE